MDKTAKKPKFSFEKLKEEATSPNVRIRMASFRAYFEQFEELPSYLFDNERRIDDMLLETVNALQKDSGTSTAMKKALVLLLERMPAHS